MCVCVYIYTHIYINLKMYIYHSIQKFHLKFFYHKESRMCDTNWSEEASTVVIYNIKKIEGKQPKIRDR